MPCSSQYDASAASSAGSSIVPVGLAGLATTRPLMSARRSAATWSTVGWNRVSGPVGISTTSQPRALSTLR